MDKDAVVQEWARRYLRSQGEEVADDETLYVYEGTYDSGYCETCSYEEQVIYISREGAGYYDRTMYYGTFLEVLDELLEIGAGN